MKKTAACVVLGLGLLSAGGMASATQYTWDFDVSGTKTSTDGGYLEFGPSGQKLKVYAFETSSSDGSGKLQTAQVRAEGNFGLGVLSSGDSETYLLDNSGKDEVLVFDSQMADFDWSSLKLGSIESGSKLTYWAGDGVTGFDINDFTNFCLTTTCSGTSLGAMNSGFGGPTTVGLGSSVGLTTKNTGRYLVVSGQLPNDGNFEKFKIKSTGGYGQAPEPESLALIGIGLLAMLGLRRRSINMTARTELTPA
jgi:hypothetical protein